MQSKIAKVLRSDALVCRVATVEDAKKVCDYLNNLNYKSKYRYNSFLYENGKVGMTMDGNLSYNRTLSKLIKEYLILKKETNTLDNVSMDDLNRFINNQVELLKGDMKKYYMDLYQINSEEKYKDFLMICNLVSKNLDNSLTLNELFKHQEIKKMNVNNDKKIYTKQDEDKILYVVNSLANYYSIEDVHEIIMKFICTGNVRFFTRRDDIRTIVSDNFTKEKFKNIISNLGWNAFLSACKVTCDKYGEEWLYNAIDEYLIGKRISGFTRDGNVRSRLGLIIPTDLLRSVINDKIKQKGVELDTFSVTSMVLEEINKTEKNNVNGRK